MKKIFFHGFDLMSSFRYYERSDMQMKYCCCLDIRTVHFYKTNTLGQIFCFLVVTIKVYLAHFKYILGTVKNLYKVRR